MKTIMKIAKPILIAALFAAALCGCNQKQNEPAQPGQPNSQTPPKQITIGISYQNLQNEFIINIQDAVQAEAKKLNVNLIESDGQGSADNQYSQVQDFIARGVDAIILNPYDKEGRRARGGCGDSGAQADCGGQRDCVQSGQSERLRWLAKTRRRDALRRNASWTCWAARAMW